MKSLFEEMGGTYTLGADGMYYPDLGLPEEEPHYGKYGRMRLRYLKEHHKMINKVSSFNVRRKRLCLRNRSSLSSSGRSSAKSISEISCFKLPV